MKPEDLNLLRRRSLGLLLGLGLWLLGHFSVAYFYVWGDWLLPLGAGATFFSLLFVLPTIWSLQAQPPFLELASVLLPAGPFLTLWSTPGSHLLLFFALSLSLIGALFFFIKILPRQIGTRILLLGYFILLLAYLHHIQAWPADGYSLDSDTMRLLVFGTALVLLALLVLLIQVLRLLRKEPPVFEDILDR